MTKKKFKIWDMHCTSCAMNIDFDLEDTEGIKKAATSYASQICEAEYEETMIDHRKIIEVIQKIGYKATLVPETQ